MEAHRHFGKPASGSRNKGLNNRRTAILVAAVSALLAAALIYLFVTHYKKTAAPVPVVPTNATVWEATQPIQAGTPESEIVVAGLLKSTQVPASQAIAGAINDPAVLAGETSSVAISAGEQVTAADFTRVATASTSAALTPFIKHDQRGVAFTMDNEHGLTSYLQPDDTVDVMATNGKGSTEMLVRNVMIMANSNGIIVLRLTDKQALLVTASTTKYALWFALRPTVNATNSVPVGAVGTAGSIG